MLASLLANHRLAAVREVIVLLAVVADDLNPATGLASRLAYTTVDGTLIPIDRIADQKPRSVRSFPF